MLTRYFVPHIRIPPSSLFFIPSPCCKNCSDCWVQREILWEEFHVAASTNCWTEKDMEGKSFCVSAISLRVYDESVKIWRTESILFEFLSITSSCFVHSLRKQRYEGNFSFIVCSGALFHCFWLRINLWDRMALLTTSNSCNYRIPACVNVFTPTKSVWNTNERIKLTLMLNGNLDTVWLLHNLRFICEQYNETFKNLL